MGGGGGGQPNFFNANLAQNEKYWVPFRQNICRQFNFCQFLTMPMLPKMDIYNNLCRYFNFCQCQCCLKWKNMGPLMGEARVN